MKPAPFAYAQAETLDEAFGLLAEFGDDAKILAGGQSLMATLNMRLSEPELLIDINRIDGLAGLSCLLYTPDAADDSLRVDLRGPRTITKTKPTFQRPLAVQL